MLEQATHNPSILEKKTLYKLWNTAYPASIHNAGLNDLESYLEGLSECKHTFLWNDEQRTQLVAWFAIFKRNNETWFAMIVDVAHQKNGIGSRLLRAAQRSEPVLNGWVIDHNKARMADGSLYVSPLLFYKRLGFEILSTHRLETEQISAVKIRWEDVA